MSRSREKNVPNQQDKKRDRPAPQNWSRNGSKPRAWAAAFWSLLSIGNVDVSRKRGKNGNGDVVSDKVDGNVRALVDPTVIAVTVTTAVSWSLPATGLLSFSRVPGA